MKIESLMKEVAGIADDLNSMGAVKAAQSVDGILVKVADNSNAARTKDLNSNVQAIINEILEMQGKSPTSNGDGRITPQDMAWLKQNIGEYKTWRQLFDKLNSLWEQTQALKTVPPDFKDPTQQMNEHYDNQLKEDISTMRGETVKYTKSLGA